MYALYRLRELGLKVRVVDEASGVGGTWYWARYPGCRFDSESYSSGYSFSDELLQEWDWKEHYAGQPETERYLNYVADKFDLRRDIRFNTRIDSATFLKDENLWEVVAKDGYRVRGQFLSRRWAYCRPVTYPTSRGSTTSRAPGVTPANGLKKAWTWPANVWA